jgi:hypothetical protein
MLPPRRCVQYGWYPVDCTSSRPVLCEVPKYKFACAVRR